MKAMKTVSMLCTGAMLAVALPAFADSPRWTRDHDYRDRNGRVVVSRDYHSRARRVVVQRPATGRQGVGDVIAYDRAGALHQGMTGLNESWQWLVEHTNRDGYSGDLAGAIRGALASAKYAARKRPWPAPISVVPQIAIARLVPPFTPSGYWRLYSQSGAPVLPSNACT